MSYTGTGIIVQKYEGSGLFYKLKTKLRLDIVERLFTSGSETKAEIPAHWREESHWLADWSKPPFSRDIFEGLDDVEEMKVEFEIKSTTYNPDMKHDGISIGPCRNLNLVSVRRL